MARQLHFRVQVRGANRWGKTWTSVNVDGVSLFRSEAAARFLVQHLLVRGVSHARIVRGSDVIEQWRDGKPSESDRTLTQRIRELEATVQAMREAK